MSSYGMYLSASGAQALSKQLDVLSNNMANSESAGFKKEFAVIQAHHSEAIEQGFAYVGSGSINDVGGGPQMMETVTDFSAGTPSTTGVETDFAIHDDEGEQFFVITRGGDKVLTRAGNFGFSPLGVLQSDEGFPVLSADGEEIAIDTRYGFKLSEKGVITQAETGLAIPLAIEKPASLGDLVKVGHTLFKSITPTVAVDPLDRDVRQGYLEKSTTSPVTEMMDMIRLTRAYEANTKMIQNHDTSTGALVNRILKQ